MAGFEDFFKVIIDPIVFLVIIMLVFLCVVKPLFQYLAINKSIKEKELLKKEYSEKKEQVKTDRQENRKKQNVFTVEQ